MTLQVDMFDEEGVAAATPTLAKITSLAEEAVNLERLIEQLEQNQKEASLRLNQIRNTLLPDEMAQAGMSSFTLSDGSKIEVKDFCSGSLPKEADRKQAAIDWLVANGGDSLIKYEVSVPFGRRPHYEAIALEHSLKTEGFAVEKTIGVHPSTLQAFAREKLQNGDAIDLEVLGLYAGRTARIKVGGK